MTAVKGWVWVEFKPTVWGSFGILWAAIRGQTVQIHSPNIECQFLPNATNSPMLTIQEARHDER